MAQRMSKGINTSSLPSAQELIALAARPDAGAGIEKFGNGIVGGIDLAGKLADRQMARQQQMLQMQEFIRKAKEDALQKQREQGIAQELSGTSPAATRVAANIGGQPVMARETKTFNDAAPARLQTALASAEPLQTTKDILATGKEKVKSERDAQEATNMQNLKFEQAKELQRMKDAAKAGKSGKIPVSLINDENLIINQQNMLDNIEKTLSGAKASGAKGFVKSVASKVTLGNISPDIRIYEQNRPATAVSLYRALTGDTRLSDADAKARALPLLPVAGEPASVHAAKIAFLRNGLNQRRATIKQVSEMAKNNNLTSEEVDKLLVTPLPTENTGEVDPSKFIEE